jgi:hypothetical protein
MEGHSTLLEALKLQLSHWYLLCGTRKGCFCCSCLAPHDRELTEKGVFVQADAELLEAQARELGSADGLAPNASGNDLQKALGAVAEANEAGTFNYNKFFAVGLFR